MCLEVFTSLIAFYASKVISFYQEIDLIAVCISNVYQEINLTALYVSNVILSIRGLLRITFLLLGLTLREGAISNT